MRRAHDGKKRYRTKQAAEQAVRKSLRNAAPLQNAQVVGPYTVARGRHWAICLPLGGAPARVDSAVSWLLKGSVLELLIVAATIARLPLRPALGSPQVLPSC